MKISFLVSIFSALFLTSIQSWAQVGSASNNYTFPPAPSAVSGSLQPLPEWAIISASMKDQRAQETKFGWSYAISGGIGFLGGFGGQQFATDPLEKGAYTVFQSIGIAAIGYGLYKVYMGSDEQNFYSVLESNPELTISQKEKLFHSFQLQKKELEKKENRIRALTHGLIALLNINNASQLGPGVVRDSLFFVGGVNALACASYSFEF